MTALIDATAILYPLEIAVGRSHTLGKLVSLNPFTPILELARKWVIDSSVSCPGTVAGGGSVQLLLSIGINVVACVFAGWIFRREARVS